MINAPARIVWDTLVNPEKTRQYMFGCETVSDWKKGSLLEWKGLQDGKDFVFVTGTIKDIVPEKFLAYTAIDPHASIDQIPENYLTITYELSEQNGRTRLNVTQGDYNKVAEGERRYKESNVNGEGWSPILEEIKKLAESQVTV